MEVIKRPKTISQNKYRSLVGESLGNDDSLIMGEMFGEIMDSRGIEVSEEQALFTLATFHLWTQEKSMNKPVIINSPCGSGKSTMIEVFASYMVRRYPNTFGCVIVKDKLSQVEETVASVNRSVGKEVAYGLKGFNPKIISKIEYQEQFKEQLVFPILVITQAMLSRKANSGTLEEIAYFYNEESFKQRRTQLLIDEKPHLVSTFTFNEKTLHDLFLDIKKVTGGKGTGFKQFEVVFKQLRRKLEKHNQENSVLPSIQKSYTINKRLRIEWDSNYDGEDFGKLFAFEKIIQQGGYLTTNQHGQTSITYSCKTFFEWTILNPFIMDGTSSIDMEYSTYHDKFLLLQPMEVKSYDHVTFKLCDQTTFSKSFFANNEDSFVKTVQMVKDIVKQHEKTMVVVYKQDLSQYQEAFSDEIEQGKIMLKYFDNGRSTNEYQDCDSAIFLSWLLKPANQYLAKTSAIVGKLVDHENTRHKTKGFMFADKRAEYVKLHDLILERIQDIERTRLGTKRTPKTIYMFHRDMNFLQKITSHFPNANSERFVIIEKLSDSKQTNEDNLIEFLRTMKNGTEVKGKYLYEEVLNVDRKTLSRLQRKPRVTEAMKQFGIKKVGQKFVKE